ncbi:uncharacterized protein LOC132047149 isoform X1 [Lycium ferocissimum]|uniref:uncharacterized protein LOC132047149 isoform X1 n=1 Tax=Lycium ferocissimum TaxID=112874 RepID=UPI002814BA7A|nr:uncharacterized protein LOC132047149 isoform X1 [Lycium ferocissimum]
MEAVKKAYAEIILNMAKEAAARVMASEKKALQYQQDLHSTKEEALRMLLRLKSMTDTKTTGAESLSQNQQRRIDELEAQLNEAEGLIIDLRAELHDVHEQLNEVKNKHFHHLRPHGKEDLVCRNSNMPKSKLNNKLVDMSDITLCNYSKDNQNEPEIYQNGWCAVEMSLADESLRSGDDPSFPIEVTKVTEPSGRAGGAHSVPSSKKLDDLVGEDPLKGHASKQRPYTFRAKRRRKARYCKTKTSSCLLPVRRRSIRKRRVNYLTVSCPALLSHSSHSNQPMRPGQQCPSFSNSKSNTVECTVKSTKLGDEGGSAEGTGVQALSSDFNAENKICRNFVCADNDAHEDKGLIDVSVMVEEGDGKPLLNFGMLPVESVLGVAKESEGSKESPLQGNNKTHLKYTFSRKRKKDNLLNTNENPYPESSMKKRSSEIENIDPILQDSKSVKDSPLRSKQLVQVARQLISLSGRSWWQ